MRPIPEKEQHCVCSACKAVTKAFPDADGKWDCFYCGYRHYPSKGDFGEVFKFSQERDLNLDNSKPTPKEVAVVVGICGNLCFTQVIPEDAYRECLTECLADHFTESGRYTIECKSYKEGDPMASDYGWECSPTIAKIEE